MWWHGPKAKQIKTNAITNFGGDNGNEHPTICYKILKRVINQYQIHTSGRKSASESPSNHCIKNNKLRHSHRPSLDTRESGDPLVLHTGL